MTQPSELDDQSLYNYLLAMQEDERTAYIADLDDEDRARVNSLLMYGYTPEEDAGVEQQTEDAYPGYENRQQPTEGDYTGWAQEEENEDGENEDEDVDNTPELVEDQNADTGWKAPSTDDQYVPQVAAQPFDENASFTEEDLGNEIDDILANDPDVSADADDNDNDKEQTEDEDEQTEGDDDIDLRSEADDDLDIRAEEEEQDEADFEDDDAAAEIDYDAAARVSKAAIAAIVARDATNRTTTFMQLPGGEFLFGSGHSVDIVATAAGGSGTVRFSRNRLSANDFIVENESGDVDYEGLQDTIRSIVTDTSIYDYGDQTRVRVK